jgi:hypothetical protein
MAYSDSQTPDHSDVNFMIEAMTEGGFTKKGISFVHDAQMTTRGKEKCEKHLDGLNSS